ncbi:hypothetical protein BH23CHL5_BH23CHL5_26630 [soil metagenome]
MTATAPHDFGGPEELIDQLRKTPLILQGLVLWMPEDAPPIRLSDDDWSVLEIIGHLIDAERRAIARIALLQAEEIPNLEGYDPDALVKSNDYQSVSLKKLVENFVLLRLERIQALEQLGDKEWLRTARIDQLGMVTMLQITAHMCWHDMNHLAQIAAIRKAKGSAEVSN